MPGELAIVATAAAGWVVVALLLGAILASRWPEIDATLRGI